MTDQELVQAITEDFAPHIRELCADDKMDCDHLCAGNILTAECIVFQVAERLSALQSENAEKDKHIARAEAERAQMSGWVELFCEMLEESFGRGTEETMGARAALAEIGWRGPQKEE